MHVKQAANVVDLLTYFAERREPATLAEIADDLGWPRSSTFNIVGTLADKGFLYETRARGGYYPTPLWLTLSSAIAEAEPLPPALRAAAAEVCARTGETTAVGTVAGSHVMFIDVAESSHPIRYFAKVGDRVPIHASAAGRALLAQFSLAEREAIYRKIDFEQYGSTTPMRSEEVEAKLRRAEARGYHQSEAEFVPDLVGVALPIPLAQRRLSMVVAGPATRCLERREQTAVILRETLARFSAELGS
ncbi:IclR family transcriptional regulator [Caulobacter segnis]|uniref:IclR family transcriptional regulator n=1 Tax=Caulobacter segnis TaxID=88688 RepID=UPI00240EFE82|nr:IclR family transcriptional regulator [Caulobacter segnis]MDG2523013.1 IclR family transcriptional regulator [Caulobacter segnis]